ncbi:MAG: hypothetical protein ACRD1W_05305, partial [Vicinamibacterales bacterium]
MRPLDDNALSHLRLTAFASVCLGKQVAIGYTHRHPMTSELWILAFGAAVAGLVQGISGFAFAMVAMSIWVWG